MNKEILKNIWDYLTSQKAIKADFETWTKNFTGNPEVQVNVHKYLLENQAIKADFETWSNNVGLKKRLFTTYFSRGCYGVSFTFTSGCTYFFGIFKRRA